MSGSNPGTATDGAVPWDLQRIVAELRSVRECWRLAHQRQHEFGGREFPPPGRTREAQLRVAPSRRQCWVR